jgi:DNA-binding transcriptional LysR family regulator
LPNKLPPLNALKVFEVAARKLSFSKAAEELCVTQGAISKQIKSLEEHLELALFDRTNTGLKLTKAGKQYLPTIMSALEQIQSSTANLQQQESSSQSLTLNITPSLSNLWLIPRLNKLSESLPNLRLNMVSGDGVFQFHQASADIAIRCLPLSLSHENSTLLAEEVLLPVIHPDLLSKIPINTVSDILKHPLLMHTTRPQLWSQFLNRVLTEDKDTHSTCFHHGFEHFFMSLEAAKQKQGIALVPNFLALEFIEKGELVNPLNIQYKSSYGFYFLVPAYRQQNDQVQQFYQWLQGEINSN